MFIFANNLRNNILDKTLNFCNEQFRRLRKDTL